MRKLLTAGLLPAMLVGWTGCAKAPEPTEPTPPAATPGEAAPATAETPPAATPAAAFQWTAAPTVEMIPADPVRGEANGKPFEVKFICFEPTSDGWRLTLTDKAFEEATAILSDCQSVNVDLKDEPQVGAPVVKAMAYGDGYWQIAQLEKPTETTSWNADNAFVLELTQWDRKPYDEKGEMFQEGGQASGKIAVCYKGSEGSFQNSWIAGTFTNVPIRYMGKPAQ